jgi:hypothetical protein
VIRITDTQLATIRAAFAVMRVGEHDFEAYRWHPLAPGQAMTDCAVCGPLPSGVRREFYVHAGTYIVVCHQCCNAWSDILEGDRASRVGKLLEAAAQELLALRRAARTYVQAERLLTVLEDASDACCACACAAALEGRPHVGALRLAIAVQDLQAEAWRDRASARAVVVALAQEDARA